MNGHQSSRTVNHIGVVGLGFVGLPLAIEFWRAGVRVTGIDVDETKITRLRKAQNYVSSIPDRVVHDLSQSKTFHCSTNFADLNETDAILICVPTPITSQGLPDLTYVLESSRSVATILRRGHLVVLESSTFPGTTEHYVKPVLESSGLQVGVDFQLAYSPERINPGDSWKVYDIPKVVGGIDDDSLDAALTLYQLVFKQLVPVSSPSVAELTKLLENTQRFVVISLMNELAVLCNEWNINLWEAIDAASTKPYGFVPAYPGPGVGGHCIPVDPMYLDWYAAQGGKSLRFVQLAKEINDRMPLYITERIMRIANTAHTRKPSVLLLGLAYKPNVNDIRDSANLIIFEELIRQGVEVTYYDPYIPSVRASGATHTSRACLEPDLLKSVDVVVVLTNHSNVDYDVVVNYANKILDTRNQYHDVQNDKIIRL